MNMLDKTLELSNEERMEYWLNLAEKLGDRDETEYPIEDVDDVYLENGITEKKLFGFYEDTSLEEFFIACNINNSLNNKDNICTLTLGDKKYQIETVDLINRHGDDLPEETVYQLHTLIKL